MGSGESAQRAEPLESDDAMVGSEDEAEDDDSKGDASDDEAPEEEAEVSEHRAAIVCRDYDFLDLFHNF